MSVAPIWQVDQIRQDQRKAAMVDFMQKHVPEGYTKAKITVVVTGGNRPDKVYGVVLIYDTFQLDILPNTVRRIFSMPDKVSIAILKQVGRAAYELSGILAPLNTALWVNEEQDGRPDCERVEVMVGANYASHKLVKRIALLEYDPYSRRNGGISLQEINDDWRDAGGRTQPTRW